MDGKGVARASECWVVGWTEGWMGEKILWWVNGRQEGLVHGEGVGTQIHG